MGHQPAERLQSTGIFVTAEKKIFDLAVHSRAPHLREAVFDPVLRVDAVERVGEGARWMATNTVCLTLAERTSVKSPLGKLLCNPLALWTANVKVPRWDAA
jgi:hypothetical protein